MASLFFGILRPVTDLRRYSAVCRRWYKWNILCTMDSSRAPSYCTV